MPRWIATPVPEIQFEGKPFANGEKLLSNEAVRVFYAGQLNDKSAIASFD
jgi:hypothetical protein